MIVAMEVKTAEDVKGSKSLRCYTFEAPDQERLTIVANQTYVYSPGDIVAVAQVGTILPDGLEITKRKVFGIESSGMALGPIDVPLGQVVPVELISFN